MDTADKHYKFINSKTGYAIYYYTIHAGLLPEQVKAELDKIKAQVAIKNSLYQETLYWEEIRDAG
ncbi:hypothetical protein A0256_09145 [Mucilaginibacter sp. PAMC 26640]|nr:hypothetical protein A0256_09145 [Mucilaginibacter sp. PAMC 26640]